MKIREREVQMDHGMILTCNACDRIIYRDEYKYNPMGYCPECFKESDDTTKEYLRTHPLTAIHTRGYNE